MDKFSLYLHIPFCIHKCSYCDFNTYAGLEELIPDYVRALCLEIEQFEMAAERRLPLDTVFLGGGTPSLLPAGELERIFETIEYAFQLQTDAEITLEANPGTLSAVYLRDLRAIGVNRLSIGMQSSRPEELALLERQHSYMDVIRGVKEARLAGFDNLNVDLIFGLPYQTLDSWQRSLDLVLELDPDHFSLYALTLEHGTPLHSWVDRGLVNAPDPDLAAEMYEWSADRLGTAGFEQYEISNWARASGQKDFTCRHNLQYWRNQPYIGLGAGAHGFVGGFRTANVLAPAAYIRRCAAGEKRPFPRTAATLEGIPIDRSMEMRETLLMGLRLTEEGVSKDRFERRFGTALEREFEAELSRLMRRGLLEWAGPDHSVLRLTPGARLLGNQVFMEFV
ncbi:MAG: radical SAM family heme chaperone HemW [Anaerolineales bacterium]|nr:radical SAM family heme chaperone HemW [Anaerolineales bacterium]